MLVQLTPISFGRMIGFVVLCKRYGIDSFVTLFRYFYFHNESEDLTWFSFYSCAKGRLLVGSEDYLLGPLMLQ